MSAIQDLSTRDLVLRVVNEIAKSAHEIFYKVLRHKPYCRAIGRLHRLDIIPLDFLGLLFYHDLVLLLKIVEKVKLLVFRALLHTIDGKDVFLNLSVALFSELKSAVA